MKKKIAALVLALVLALSLGGTTALAATKPSMKLVSVSTTSIKRGKRSSMEVQIGQRLLQEKSGVCRAEFGTFLCKGSVNIGTVYAYVNRYVLGQGRTGR